MLMAPLATEVRRAPRRDSIAAQDEASGFLAFMGEHQAFQRETKAG